MDRKRCFVISPIGLEGSPTREHADDVYDFIIKPAMEECGILAVRSDQLREPGKISEHMFREILTDDLCIAVLTGHNPNVFYELAIAQASARPVIILLEKGSALPFDVHDLRCVYYDLKPRSLFGKVYVNEIIEHVRGLERADWQATTPWGTKTSTDRASLEGSLAFFPYSQDYGNSDVWLQLLQDTHHTFDLMGIALGSWRRTRRFSDTLREKAAEGCKVRILLMHTDNPALPHFINEAIPECRYTHVVRNITEMSQYFAEVAAGTPNIAVRQMLQGCPHGQLTRSEQAAVFILYLYSERSHFSPLWRCPQDTPLYTTLTTEFETLWKANEPAARPVTAP
jgi:hypothetical protein